jgi:tetratricopeptide (TPR) repeat protein
MSPVRLLKRLWARPASAEPVREPEAAPSAWTPPPAHAATLALEDAARRRSSEDTAACLETVLNTPGLGDYEMLAAGVVLKEFGFAPLAERLLLHLLDRQPDYPYGWYELGAVRRWMGRTEAAEAALARASELDPERFEFRFALAEMLHGLGRHDAAVAEIGRLAAESDRERERVDTLEAFAPYLSAFPKGEAVAILSKVRAQYDWIGHREVAARMETAVRDRRPFALIRLGDGEGAFARISQADEARFAALYSWMRADWVSFLFGPDFDAKASGYAALTEGLMEVAKEADVLGVPYQSWVEHEYDHVSARGVPCVLNIHRNLLAHPPAVRPALCDQLVHVHLHNDGLIAPILRSAGRITIISCLSGLADLVAEKLGLEEVEFLPVPREYTAPHLRGADHMEGEAFPGAYDDTMRRLSQAHHGRVFIVAAGTLGKFYAAAIKRHGGVALDLGSLVDGWMRLPSRADYNGNLAL